MSAQHPLAALLNPPPTKDARTTKQQVYGALEKAHSQIDRLTRMLQLIDDIGEDRVERLIAFMDGDDPDKSKSTLVVGVHGPGCTCPPDRASDVEEDPEPTVN